MTRRNRWLPCAIACLVCSSAFAAGPAAKWSKVTGDQCERVVTPETAVTLTMPAGTLPSCGIALADVGSLGGHRVVLSASFHATAADATNVVLMLTQFRNGTIRWHQYVTGRTGVDGAVTLRLQSYVLPASDAATVSVQAVDATAPITVADLAMTATAAVAEGEMGRDARTYLDTALGAIASDSIALEPARRDALLEESRALASGAVRPDETYDAIRYALVQIGDGHSRFFDPATAHALTSMKPKAPYDITRASLDRSIGYLGVPEFGATDPGSRASFADFLDFSLRGVLSSSVDGLVVDLRSDGGGSLDAMTDGLCLLFPPHTKLIGFADRTRERFVWTCRTRHAVDARTRARAQTMPVAVLVGPTTASAGEMLAVALKGRDRTILIGAPTRGLTTNIRVIPMRDDAMLLLATAILVDRAGERYPHGVTPEIVAPPRAEATVDQTDPAIMRAREWIAASIRARGSSQ